MFDQTLPKLFDANDVVLPRQRVDRVLDRVRGQNPGVIAGFVAAQEIAAKENLECDFFHVVAALPPRQLYQTNARFPVRIG
jgi:hypothetical protein